MYNEIGLKDYRNILLGARRKHCCLPDALRACATIALIFICCLHVAVDDLHTS